MATAARIFINYRRDDAAGWASKIKDDLEEHWPGEVFLDTGIPHATDFEAYINGVLSRCDVFIAVMGRRWATLADADGTPRISAEDDLLREEIETALARPDVLVVPVLVDGAQMPYTDRLPARLRPLARINAPSLRARNWETDFAELLAVVSGRLGASRQRRREPGLRSETALWGLGVAALAVIPAAAAAGAFRDRGSGEAWTERALWFAVERGLFWGILGALALGWAAVAIGRPQAAPGTALLGFGAGAIGGGLGGFAHQAMSRELLPGGEQWLYNLLSLSIAGALIGIALASLMGGGPWRGAAAGLTGGIVAATIDGLIDQPDDGAGRLAILALWGVVVVGAVLAVVLAAQGSTVPRRVGAARASH